jgi:signal transduction histidine kinase
VVDDGRGRRPNGSGGPPAGGGGGAAGLGIMGMRERAAAVGGALEVGSRPDGGFRVRARLPAPRGVGGAGAPGDAP